MQEEIKNILKCLEMDMLDNTQIEILLDYITNLQEENTKLIELCDKYEEEHNNAFKLWTMKMEEMPDYEERMNYKSRNEKAIELLNDWNYLDKIDCYYEPKEVIDILKGDNK